MRMRPFSRSLDFKNKLERNRRFHGPMSISGERAVQHIKGRPGRVSSAVESDTRFSRSHEIRSESAIPPTGVELSQFEQGFKALSESGGHPGGQFGSDSETVASLRQQALTSLQLAWRDIRRMESLSDDPAESKVAGRALAFVDRAFEELEGGKR